MCLHCFLFFIARIFQAIPLTHVRRETRGKGMRLVRFLDEMNHFVKLVHLISTH